jgi:hypothetical protein
VSAVRTTRGHLVERDVTGRILVFRSVNDRRPLALTDGDLWELAQHFLGFADGIVQRLNAEEAEQAVRYGRDAFLWEKRRHRRDPRKDTP